MKKKKEKQSECVTNDLWNYCVLWMNVIGSINVCTNIVFKIVINI